MHPAAWSNKESSHLESSPSTAIAGQRSSGRFGKTGRRNRFPSKKEDSLAVLSGVIACAEFFQKTFWNQVAEAWQFPRNHRVTKCPPFGAFSDCGVTWNE
jgi:hypothetical protein